MMTAKYDRTNTLDKLKKEYYSDYRNDLKFHIQNLNRKDSLVSDESWKQQSTHDLFNRPPRS
jgi:hypothetical protein